MVKLELNYFLVFFSFKKSTQKGCFPKFSVHIAPMWNDLVFECIHVVYTEQTCQKRLRIFFQLKERIESMWSYLKVKC